MLIKNIRVESLGNKISLLADCKIRTIGMDTVYFSFDKKYAGFLVPDASPFAATLLVPSMWQGEDLIIKGSVSRSLYEGMHRVMDTMLGWNIGMKKIKISADQIKEDELSPKGVASFFSGGVDSFYTFLKHKSDQVDPISHFILIKGTDIDIRNEGLWKLTRDNIQKIVKDEKIELIEAESNIQSLLEPITSPDFTHGGTLAAFALCLRAGLKKIYIASSISNDYLFVPWGSHPYIDKHWNSEQTSFLHDGVEASRFDKMDWQVAHSPLAMKHLRVCFMNINNSYNCGKCEKCVRTMIDLKAAGKLSLSETFPHSFDYKKVAEIVSSCGDFEPIYRQSLSVLQKRNIDKELQEAIEQGLLKVTDPSSKTKEVLFKKVLYIDHMYFRGFLYKIWTTKIRDKVK